MANVVAQPHFIFGLRTGVKNNLCFCDEQTVVFPAGNNCVCYNTIRSSQRLVPGSEKSQAMCALAISANRRYLAVAERAEKATVAVLDLHHQPGKTKRRVLSAGDLPAQEFICLAFSPDSKYLIGQTGAPEWTLIFWFWEKHKILATVKTGTSNNPVKQVSFNPFNHTQLCVSGAGVFKLFRYAEGCLKQSSFAKVDSIHLLSHAWIAPERVVAGTDTGRLLVFENGDLRRELLMSADRSERAADRRFPIQPSLSVSKTGFHRQVEMKRIKGSDLSQNPTGLRVASVVSFSRGFACSLGSGRICLFVKNENDSFTRSRDIWIPADPYSNDPGPSDNQDIESMCVSPAEETLAVSTDRGQLYSISLSAVAVDQEKAAYLDLLAQSFHSKAITGLSVCIRKPIVATSSLDCCVRIWNYETKTVDLCKEFQEEAFSVALHPTGLFILVGFLDKLRLMNLLISDIRIFKEFTVRGCRECAFSNGGHMFAAVSGNVIHIYSPSFENILNLKGHSGKVRSVAWSPDDGGLVSCGMDGAVYEWNTQSGKRASECVLKTCSYTGVVFSSDCKTILAVGTDATLKEIQDCQVLREVSADEGTYTSVAVSHSGRVVFAGNANGSVTAIKYPLPMQKEWITHQAHCGPVTKVHPVL
uniref:Cilia and flagella associated protein 57 n=1 Tax=Tetraodon nigroviridis TaxID=99883 RepID=H3CPL1_TETNG